MFSQAGTLQLIFLCTVSFVILEVETTTAVLPAADTQTTESINVAGILTDEITPGCTRQDVTSQTNKHLTEILKHLKALGIIDITNTRCFSIEEIRKSVQKIPEEDGLLQVGVYFFIRDLQEGQQEVKQNRSHTIRAAEDIKCVDLMRSESRTEAADVVTPPLTTMSNAAASVRRESSSDISNSGDEDGESMGMNLSYFFQSTKVILFGFIISR